MNDSRYRWDDSPLQWYALRVKAQHERTTATALASRGIEGYAPLYRSRRRWSDRMKDLQLPLFPRYLFCRTRIIEKGAVLACPGVYSFIGFGNQPAVVSEDEIANLRRMEEAGLPYGPWPFLKAGQQVRITSGPLSGLAGVLACAPETWRVVVNVELLQRSVAVTVERDQVELVGQASVCA